MYQCFVYWSGVNDSCFFAIDLCPWAKKSKCCLKLNLCPSSIGRSTGFGPMVLCNPFCNFATTFVWLPYARWKSTINYLRKTWFPLVASTINYLRKTWFPLVASTISNAMFQSCFSKLTYIGAVNLWIDVSGVVIMWGGGGGGGYPLVD
jgi:hypothetical protein